MAQKFWVKVLMDLFYWLSTLNDNENLLYFVSFQMHERNFEEVLLGLDE
jgi:hypothetical protein